MTQSSALLILPPGERTGLEKDAVQGIAGLATQSLEDLCLGEGIERALRATGYGPLRDIGVTVHERRVILSGRVPSYHLKQIAQTTALTVPEAHHVRNELDVGLPR